MNDYLVIFFVFNLLIFTITILIITKEEFDNDSKLLKIIKIIAILFPTVSSGSIVIHLFTGFTRISKIDSIGADSIMINSGLSIFGILASVWIGLNIYNIVEKNEFNGVVERSKHEIQTATNKLEDISRIQIESNIADSQDSMDEKLMHYDGIIDKYVNYDLPYIFRANFMYKNEKYKEAISDYTIALLKNRDNKFLYYDRGKCYFLEQEYEKAIEDFSNAINYGLYVNSSTLNRAVACQNIGMYDKAIKDYTNVIDSMNPDHSTYNNRGVCFFNTGKIKLALDDYNMAIKLNSEVDESYYKNRIGAYMKLGMFDEAIFDIDTLINTFDDMTEEIYILRSNVNILRDKYAEANNDRKMYENLIKKKNFKEAATTSE